MSSPARAEAGSRRLVVPEWGWALIFLAPYLLGLCVFVIGPVLAAFSLSFARWDLLGAPVFVGITNFATLGRDPFFWKALLNTLYYVALVVPAEVVSALVLAVLAQRVIPGIRIFRAMLFMPSVLSLAAIGLIWSWLYAPTYGLLNLLLRFMHLPEPAWLSTPEWALPAIAITTIWRNAGYYMAIYLAALQAIPTELYEVAGLDGATGFQKCRHVMLPLISPTIFLVVVVATIWAFQVFDLTYIMTRGGPSDATLTLVYYVYLAGFQWGRMGYASALSVALFVVTMALTAMYLITQRRWVHYA